MAQVIERIAERERARQEALREKKEAASASKDGEDAGAFLRALDATLASVRKDAAALRKGCSEDAVQALIVRARDQQSALTRAVGYLAAYDVQKAQRDITAAEQYVRGRRARLMPRQDFSFDRARQRQVLAPTNLSIAAYGRLSARVPFITANGSST